MADDGESLESWLNKATNPSNRQEDWEYIMGFCDQINKELEGPQISVRLLAHKIQSPQEWEAMQALMTLEACMKNCGHRFHNEVGKFRFLNELIKVVSPKYLGDKVSEKVKTKVIEMLYSWTVSLPEAKICEAYQMLKSQGIVLVDPEIPLDATLMPSPSPRPKNPVFDDDKKSKRLADLLKSKKPEDLQEANRLIKNMVKEDEARAEKALKQKNTLEAVSNSVKLLNEMLAHFSPEDSTEGDKELIRELYGDCDKLRQTVFQLATETEDNDTNLGDILQASDDLSHVMNSYKKIVEGQAINGETEKAQLTQASARRGKFEQLYLNELQLFILMSSVISLVITVPFYCHVFQDSSQDLHLFDTTSCSGPTLSTSSLFPDALSATIAPVTTAKSSTTASSLIFSDSVFSTSAVSMESVSTQSVIFPQPSSSLLTSSTPDALSQSFSTTSPAPSATLVTPQQVSTSHGASHSPTATLSKVCPVTAYDRNGVRVLLHFAIDCPPGRPDVLVMVASMLNTAPLPVRNINLQAAVPKTMKVRLQPPSGTELAPFNPILPPSAITQVMLLANPLKEKVRMRYKLTFTLGEQTLTEMGEVNEFPPADKWGAL
uniref:Golgi associated, gamma adaptin ear containing, ARF binding protein 3a n=1 Tax=Anabas testudineus TaxID=64144 RepID=A0A7N6A735_ANATE